MKKLDILVPVHGNLLEVLRGHLGSLSSAEVKVARVLFESNLLAGLDNASRLAQKAGVSAPTINRFAETLGFETYADFQDAVFEDCESRIKGPTERIHDQDAAVSKDQLQKGHYIQIAEDSFSDTNIAALTEVAKLLSNTSVDVLFIGGKFSHVIAKHTYLHLNSLRKNTRLIRDVIGRQEQLFDVKKGSFGVIFDFRRYQHDVFDFARELHKRNGRIILFTDQYLSPVAELAEFVFAVPVEIPSPFDSPVGAVMLAEALIARINTNIGAPAAERLHALDRLRTELKAP